MTTRNIRWTASEWQLINEQIYEHITDTNPEWLPLRPVERYPMLAWLSRAQEILDPNRRRPVKTVPTPARLAIIEGVNTLALQRMRADKIIHSLPVCIRKSSEKPNQGGELAQYNSEQELVKAMQANASNLLPRQESKDDGFTFESLGRSVDNYLTGRIDKAIAFALAAFIPGSLQTTLEAKPSIETKLLNDMVAVLDEVTELRKQVSVLTAPVNQNAAAKVKLDTADNRPQYAVTGAHPPQANELNRAYANKLRLRVFVDVFPNSDLSACEEIYVFEAHSNKAAIDKLRHRYSRAVVHPIRGGISSIKSALDGHVRTSQAIAASELAIALGGRL